MSVYMITDYGVKPNQNATEAIRKAVKDCHEHGGGTVVFPKGQYISSSVRLLDNVRLYLEKGCTVTAIPDLSQYEDTGFFHNEMKTVSSLFWARNAERITIAGEGLIDLNGHAFYPKAACDSDGDSLCPKNEKRLNQPIFFESCRDIVMEDIQIVDSPCWTVTFSRCTDVTVRRLTVRNSFCIPNCDGLHFCACDGVSVSDCELACGDDCIALTCITDRRGVNRNIRIENCRLRSNSAAVRIGHSVANLRIENLTVSDSNRCFAVFTAPNTAITDVKIDNVALETRQRNSGWWGAGEAVVLAAVQSDSKIERVSLSDIRGTADTGIIAYGNIRGLHLRNVHLRLNSTQTRQLDLRPYLPLSSLPMPVGCLINGAEKVTVENTDMMLT